MVITIKILLVLTRFRKRFSVGRLQLNFDSGQSILGIVLSKTILFELYFLEVFSLMRIKFVLIPLRDMHATTEKSY